MRQERTTCNSYGRIIPFNAPVIPGTIAVFLRNIPLQLSATQPDDGSYIQLEKPYPERYSKLLVNYQFNPKITIINELALIPGTNVLKAVSVFSYINGRNIPGTIAKVNQVRNITKSLDYTLNVSSFSKEFIFMNSMPSYSSGDEISISYEYIKPWIFLIEGIAPKKRYENAWILENAVATIVTPYYCQMSPNDVITALSGELQGFEILNPNQSGLDIIKSYFDVSRITRIIDKSGKIYDPSNVTLFERNKLIWNVTKPTVAYTVHFFYYPSYSLLQEYGTTRTAENKQFVNRYTLALLDKVNSNIGI
jgi:hypothetical protein